MQILLDELRELHRRATGLQMIGLDIHQRPAYEEHARTEYKAVKEGIAARLKEVERRPPKDVEDWVLSTFTAALRAAHIGMRAPTNTSPKNSSWQNSVHELADELAYYVDTLTRGLAT